MAVLTVDANSFVDTAVAVDATTHFVTSPFARIQVSTEATSVDVSVYNNISAFTDLDRIGVYVDGAYNQQVNFGAGASTVTVTLPPGAKTVDFVNGPTTHDDGTNSAAALVNCSGCWITSLDFNAAFTQLFPAASPKVLIWGDSIAVGDGAYTTPTGDVQEKAWPIQVRLAFSGSVAVEAWGYRKLFDDAGDSTKRARFVDLVELHAPDRFIMCCGTNDYGLGSWANAAAFGTAYAATLDDLNSALPNMKIFCVTPVLRNPDGTLQSYRDQIVTAALARKSYVTLVRGDGILTVADLADNVHPNGGGHTKLANYLLPYANGRMPGFSALQFRA